MKTKLTSCFTDPGRLSGGSNIGRDSGCLPSPIDGMPNPDMPPIPIQPALPGPGDIPLDGSGINPMRDGSGVDMDLLECGMHAAEDELT